MLQRAILLQIVVIASSAALAFGGEGNWRVPEIAKLGDPAIRFLIEQTIYVDAAVEQSGDGTSWASPFKYLNQALAVGEYAEIRVAGGMYHPDRDANAPAGDGDPHSSFMLPGGALLIGGYAGLAGGPGGEDVRDLDLYPTVLSGQLNLDLRAMHVVRASFAYDPIELDGLVIQDGRAAVGGFTSPHGAGLLIEGTDITLRRCTIQNNETADPNMCAAAGNGAGIYAGSEGENSITLIDCLVRDNATGDGAPCGECSAANGGDGAGLYAAGYDVVLQNTTLSGNVCGAGGDGANCQLRGFGDGARGGAGGAAAFEYCYVVVRDCLVAGNAAGNGGDGAWYAVGGDGGNAGGFFVRQSSVDIVNATFADNAAGFGGLGGLVFDPNDPNLTAADGLDGLGAALYADPNGSFVTIANSIAWANLSGDGQQLVGATILTHSCVAGVDPDNGNIDLDPSFADLDDYHLSPDSPCIDAGDELGVDPRRLDLDGEPRLLNERVDMGVDEVYFADCNVNGVPDAVEIDDGLVDDCDQNGVPDECDIADAIWFADEITPIGSNRGWWVRLASGPSGLPMAAYVDPNTVDIRLAWFDGYDWNDDVVVSEAGAELAVGVDLEVTLANLPVAAWSALSFVDGAWRDVYIAEATDDGWSVDYVTTVGANYDEVSLAIGRAGRALHQHLRPEQRDAARLASRGWRLGRAPDRLRRLRRRNGHPATRRRHAPERAADRRLPGATVQRVQHVAGGDIRWCVVEYQEPRDRTERRQRAARGGVARWYASRRGSDGHGAEAVARRGYVLVGRDTRRGGIRADRSGRGLQRSAGCYLSQLVRPDARVVGRIGVAHYRGRGGRGRTLLHERDDRTSQWSPVCRLLRRGSGVAARQHAHGASGAGRRLQLQ